MKKILYILCAVFLLAACDKDVHDEPQPGHGFLSVALLWEDKINSTDEIESINLWIYDKTGALAADKVCSSPFDIASQKYEIQAGTAMVVIGVNVKEQMEPKHTATVEDLKFELARQCALYEMTFYGDKTAEVVGGENRTVYVPLHDKPQDNTYIEPDPDIDDWEDGEDDNGDVFKPNK